MRDRKYVTRFQNWDFSAFEVLYERYIDKIYAFVLRKTSDHEVAEDLTSQIWMKVLKSLEFFWEKENAGFSSWLYRIAGNTVIDYYRCNKSDTSLDDVVEIWFSQDIASHIDDTDTLERVLEYLEELKPIEKEIVILRVWDDLSYKEIAEICQKKEDNCKKIFSRALGKIKANIGILLLFVLILL